MPNETTVPDFATLFAETSDDADGCLTPHCAALLHVALGYLADFARADIDTHGGAPVDDDRIECWAFFGRLPRTSWQQDVTWRRRWVSAAEYLAGRLAQGEQPVPRCIAEEIVLYLAIDDADADAADTTWERPELPVLPPYCSDDWDALRDILFDDHDFLALFSEPADGAEDRHSIPYRVLGGSAMRSTWFERFNAR